uniref:Protein kinase domain-containing protein n=1 Tax=Timema monikensis TaxID=170555 RepID=A0A7R9HUI7_9NEOP|nr:unnamed protein product [Timema monikensis]
MASEKMKSIVKVTDFGLSKFINEETLATTYCGSPHYVAPEILQNQGRGSYTKKVDVWSLGVVLYVCLAGYFPFKDSDTLRLINEIVHGLYSFNKEPWTKVSDDAKNLIQKMMTLDPEKRLSINEVLNHQWLKDKNMEKEVKNLLKKHKHDYNQKQFYRTQLNKQGRRLTSGSNSDETVGLSPKKVKQAHVTLTVTLAPRRTAHVTLTVTLPPRRTAHVTLTVTLPPRRTAHVTLTVTLPPRRTAQRYLDCHPTSPPQLTYYTQTTTDSILPSTTNTPGRDIKLGDTEAAPTHVHNTRYPRPKNFGRKKRLFDQCPVNSFILE